MNASCESWHGGVAVRHRRKRAIALPHRCCSAFTLAFAELPFGLSTPLNKLAFALYAKQYQQFLSRFALARSS